MDEPVDEPKDGLKEGIAPDEEQPEMLPGIAGLTGSAGLPIGAPIPPDDITP